MPTPPPAPPTPVAPVPGPPPTKSNPTPWIIVGVLALALGVAIGFIVKPFGAPTPPAPPIASPSVTVPQPTPEPESPTPEAPATESPAPTAAATTPAQTPAPPPSPAKTLLPANAPLCSIGTNTEPMYAGALGLIGPTGNGWRNHDLPAPHWAACFESRLRPIGESGALVMVGVRKNSAGSLGDATQESTQWLIEAFGGGAVSKMANTSGELEGRALQRRTFNFQSEGITYGVTAIAGAGKDGKRAVIIGACMVSNPQSCTEVDQAMKTLRWVR